MIYNCQDMYCVVILELDVQTGIGIFCVTSNKLLIHCSNTETIYNIDIISKVLYELWPV